MITKQSIKKIVFDEGADLCGVASVDRFSGAPEGFNPKDIYDKTQSVLVFSKRLPVESLFAQSCVPYTHTNSLVTQIVDNLTFTLSIRFEDLCIKNVPIHSDDPYEYFDTERARGQGILSMRHAGYLAGLGVLVKNTLLINEKYGNMIQIGALLLDIPLESDELADYFECPAGCELCMDACPVNALDGTTVNQKHCRPLSNYKTEKGYILKKCYECRKACPVFNGIRKI